MDTQSAWAKPSNYYSSHFARHSFYDRSPASQHRPARKQLRLKMTRKSSASVVQGAGMVLEDYSQSSSSPEVEDASEASDFG